jgi:hypothetical protein
MPEIERESCVEGGRQDLHDPLWETGNATLAREGLNRVIMSIKKWCFDFHLLEQGWSSAPPCREGTSNLQPPGKRVVTLRMIEFGSEEKPDIWYEAEILYIDSNRAKVTELISKHSLPKSVLVNCWAQQQDLEQQLAAPHQG